MAENQRIPRAPRGRIGFDVAIEFENSEQVKQLRADFVVTLRDLLNGSKLRHRFSFIDYPQAIAKRVTDDQQAEWLLRKGNLHFLIHGRARLRTVQGKPAHVLDLQWMVRHTPIAHESSVQFASETNTVFPRQLILGSVGDMFVCDFAAQHVDALARFVIGTASALSNDFSYAEQLLRDAETRLTQLMKKAEGAPISVLADMRQGQWLLAGWDIGERHVSVIGVSRRESLEERVDASAETPSITDLKEAAGDALGYASRVSPCASLRM